MLAGDWWDYITFPEKLKNDDNTRKKKKNLALSLKFLEHKLSQ